MGTMNISLPDTMKEFVDEQVTARGYGTSSEYIRDLIRREQDRDKLRKLLVEGIESGRGAVADAAFFESLRQNVRDAAAAKRGSAKTGPAGAKARRAR